MQFENEAQEQVSLFTREWIEMTQLSQESIKKTSPSLRGSGLKYLTFAKFHIVLKSPSLRGSGLKFRCCCVPHFQSKTSPSLRGSGLKCLVHLTPTECFQRLPLYEGVD